jgi:hypothetical protein
MVGDLGGRGVYDVGLRSLGLWNWWDRIPPVAWMTLCREHCVLSVRGLCVWPITRPSKFFRVLSV